MVGLLLGIALADDGPPKPIPPPPGTIELIVRGPDGKPAADTDVAIFLEDGSRPGATGNPLTVKTDRAGLARFNSPAGAVKVKIKATGVGYGATGDIGVTPGETTHAALPRLVPFGTVKGTIPPDLLKPDMKVRFGPSRWGNSIPFNTPKTTDREYGWLFLEASVDEQGQFEFKEIPCGSGWIYAGVKEEEPVIAEADVKLEPNRLFQRVVLVKFELPVGPGNASGCTG